VVAYYAMITIQIQNVTGPGWRKRMYEAYCNRRVSLGKVFAPGPLPLPNAQRELRSGNGVDTDSASAVQWISTDALKLVKRWLILLACATVGTGLLFAIVKSQALQTWRRG
jgi:hypothetical protein